MLNISVTCVYVIVSMSVIILYFVWVEKLSFVELYLAPRKAVPVWQLPSRLVDHSRVQSMSIVQMPTTKLMMTEHNTS